MTALPKTASKIPSLGPRLPLRMHKLAMEGYQRYFREPRGLSEDDLSEIRDELIALSDDPSSVWEAISGLGVLAVLVEQEGDAETGQALRALIAAGGQHLAPIAGALSKVLGIEPTTPDEGQRRAMARALANAGDYYRAARHDSPRPQGSLPLYEVDFAMVTARFRELRLPQKRAWRATFFGRF